MGRPAKLKMSYNTALPTVSGVDVRVIPDQHAMNMNKSVASGINLGVDGQTSAYIDVRGNMAKALFASKHVPMTDGTDVLTSLPAKVMSQRGYGINPARHPVAVPGKDRIGFNNTLTDTSTGKIEASCAYTKTYANHAVTSDFPKGPGGQEPNPMWEDGTYDEMLFQVQKQHVAVPEEIKFAPPPDRRRDMFNLQSLAGGEVFGDALLRKTIEDSISQQQKEEREIKAREVNPYGSDQDIQTIVREMEVQNVAEKTAKRLGLPLGSHLVQDLANKLVPAIVYPSDIPRNAIVKVIKEGHPSEIATASNSAASSAAIAPTAITVRAPTALGDESVGANILRGGRVALKSLRESLPDLFEGIGGIVRSPAFQTIRKGVSRAVLKEIQDSGGLLPNLNQPLGGNYNTKSSQPKPRAGLVADRPIGAGAPSVLALNRGYLRTPGGPAALPQRPAPLQIADRSRVEAETARRQGTSFRFAEQRGSPADARHRADSARLDAEMKAATAALRGFHEEVADIRRRKGGGGKNSSSGR